MERGHCMERGHRISRSCRRISDILSGANDELISDIHLRRAADFAAAVAAAEASLLGGPAWGSRGLRPPWHGRCSEGVGGLEERHAQRARSLGHAQDAQRQLPEAVSHHEARPRGDAQGRRPHRVGQPPAHIGWCGSELHTT